MIMLIYKILTHSRQSCKSVYFVLYFNVCTLKILPWINKFYLSIYISTLCMCFRFLRVFLICACVYQFVRVFFYLCVCFLFVRAYFNLCACISICACVFQFVRVYFNLCVCLHFWATVVLTSFES